MEEVVQEDHWVDHGGLVHWVCWKEDQEAVVSS